ncbi:hypothetical protein [Cellulosimicrobium sp. SH8]|uniref:hypothetical protein n=1 Tax=Cellulosimicrobium sp. SH8 TaxID=2952936 RepID=UPI0021F3975A|nr:hypothetical protein [Cellulosimicrobium sp. SH8]
MSTEYLKLAEAPSLVIHYPTCSTCDVDLENDGGDGWTCPSCGTSWDYGADDGDTGELYESWSGEELVGPVLDEDEAFRVSYGRKREEQERYLESIGIKPLATRAGNAR